MNSQVWWFVTRASGMVAWVLLTATVLWGILLPAKMFPKQRPAWILDLHRLSLIHISEPTRPY